MQLSAGGDVTVRRQQNPQTGLIAAQRRGSEGGRLCGLSAGGTLSTGATSACISFCCSPSTVEKLQRGREVPEGREASGPQIPTSTVLCVLHLPLAGRRQTLSSSPRPRTESSSSGGRERQDGSLSTEHTECH